MKIETEYQFLCRVRKLSPEEALEAVEARYQQLYRSDTIYDEDDTVNEAINRMIAYRKKRRFKTTPEWIAGALQKMQNLSSEHKVEAINNHIASAHQGFFIPFNLQNQTNEQLNQNPKERAVAVIEKRQQRYDYS